MTLNDDKNWIAVHFADRTILHLDRELYPSYLWDHLIFDTEVRKVEGIEGHYEVVKVNEV